MMVPKICYSESRGGCTCTPLHLPAGAHVTNGKCWMIRFCRYDWIHNNSPLNKNARNIRFADDGTGSFVIEPATVLDEGSYQCKAVTQYGTALSNTSILQRAVFSSQTRPDVREVVATTGRPFDIQVEPLKCFPDPSFSWVIARVVDDDNAPTGRSIKTDRRVQISDTGKYYTVCLYFISFYFI